MCLEGEKDVGFGRPNVVEMRVADKGIKEHAANETLIKMAKESDTS